MRLTDLADVCRAAGLVVVEVSGWQNRARSGNGGQYPNNSVHVMVHHTASKCSEQQDVNYIVSCDNAPLSNLYLGRSGTVWVIAAGPTNTNGKGGPIDGVSADKMNEVAIGIEAGNDGVGEPWPQAQTDAYVRLCRALIDRYDVPVGYVRAHAEWSPGRKIDPAGNSPYASGGATWDMDKFRGDVWLADPNPPQPTPDPPPLPLEDDNMGFQLVLVDVRGDQPVYLVGLGFKTWQPDGNAWAQILTRLSECENGTKPSPWDGIVWRRFDHGGDDVIMSYGPIYGDVPPGRDRYGRLVS